MEIRSSRNWKGLNFWYVSVIDTHSEKVYVKLNQKNNPPFEFRESTQYSEFVNVLKATGVTKIINGYQCEEYLGDAFPSAEVRYYITRELPYIKYQATNVNLLGFVVEKEIYWGDKTKIKFQHILKKLSIIQPISNTLKSIESIIKEYLNSFQKITQTIPNLTKV